MIWEPFSLCRIQFSRNGLILPDHETLLTRFPDGKPDSYPGAEGKESILNAARDEQGVFPSSTRILKGQESVSLELTANVCKAKRDVLALKVSCGEAIGVGNRDVMNVFLLPLEGV